MAAMTCKCLASDFFPPKISHSNDSMTTCYFQSSFFFDVQAMKLSFSKVKAAVENAIDIYQKKKKKV